MKARKIKKKLTSKIKLKKRWNEWKGALILILIMCAFRSAAVDWNHVPTGSMKPTILEGDRIVVNKLAYDLKIPFITLKLLKWGNPKRGDIVVFYSPVNGTRFIKRVIGIPGDKIEVFNNQVILNGELQQVSEDNILSNQNEKVIISEEILNGKAHSIMFNLQRKSIRNLAPIEIPKNSYFVMGDNRDCSFDSRYFGCIKRDAIIGKGIAIAFSLNRAFTKLK